MRLTPAPLLSTCLLALAACGDGEPVAAPNTLAVGDEAVRKVEPGKADSSAEAVIVDMAFSAELIASSSWNPAQQVENQLLYTIGQLNGSDAVGRLDKVDLQNVKTERTDDGDYRITYDASIQVAWRKRQGVPATYDFILPRDVTHSGLDTFVDSYGTTCVDWGAHDVDQGSMWYYYRPSKNRCNFNENDVIKTTAQVTVSDVNTTGKYPEYHRVWEDNVFVVLAVFGKYKDGATSNSDAGIRAYNEFAKEIRGALGGSELQMDPVDAPSTPGVDVPEITYSAKIDADRRVVVYTLLVDNVRTAGASFDARYGELSRNADLIVYNGHAGLGSNIRALARKGEWQEGQYAMVFMNGCDTYAYVDSALFDSHAAVNPDDAEGTKYVDLITNALPSFFANMSEATMALVNGMLAYDNPLTYEQIFKDISSTQIVLVTGEHDNEYVPGFGDTDPVDAGWTGLSLDGDLTRDEAVTFETPVLPAGTYTFVMDGTGDADLYVRTGLAPDLSSYDCRPYKSGSKEACTIDLASPAAIFGMVRGYSATSSFALAGASE